MDIEFSWGVTEVKVAEGLVDAAVEVTETGSSLRANGLRIVEATADLDPGAGRQQVRLGDPWKHDKIQQIAFCCAAPWMPKAASGSR